MEVPAKGWRYVWEIPDVIGPIFMKVDNVLVGGDRPRVMFTCRERGRTWRKTFPFPLSEHIERRDWTDEEAES